MTDKEIEKLADQAKATENTTLAVILYAFLGSKKLNLDQSFAAHCQLWAQKQISDMHFYKDVNKAIKNKKSKGHNR